jgi:hypothetical protein
MPTWGFFNPDNPSVQKVVRAYAIFLIFFGAFACASVVCVRAFPHFAILGFPIAVAFTWFFRSRLPRLTPSKSEIAIAGSSIATKEQPLLGKHWKRGLLVIAGLGVLVTILVMVTMADSEASKMAFAAAQSNPTVKQRLGEPIKRGLFTSGSIEVSGPSGHADIAIPISGPKGRATLYAVARKSADLWKLDTLQVGFGEETERLDLLKHD